jgi:hypothetical protein
MAQARSPVGVRAKRRMKSVLIELSSMKMRQGSSFRSTSISSPCLSRSAGFGSAIESTFHFRVKPSFLRLRLSVGPTQRRSVGFRHPPLAELLQGGNRAVHRRGTKLLDSCLIQDRLLSAVRKWPHVPKLPGAGLSQLTQCSRPGGPFIPAELGCCARCQSPGAAIRISRQFALSDGDPKSNGSGKGMPGDRDP